jgi:aspartokinase-like uncharacterized kinase
MPKIRTWVVKLGGAMMHAPELAPWIQACNAASSDIRCVIVAGGGRFADEVRALQERWCLSDTLAHGLAIDGMALNARALAALLPCAPPLLDLTPLALDESSAACRVWLPQRPYRDLDLPRNWTVSADSIAFRVCQRLAGERVLLVKSSPLAQVDEGVCEDFAARGIVDMHLPEMMRRSLLPCYVMSKFDHEKYADACRSGAVCGTRLSA